MCKRVPTVEWHIAESDAAWEHRCVQPMANMAPVASRRLRLNRYFWSVVALFLLLVSAGSWWWRTERVALPPSETDVPAPAQHELEAAVLRDDPASLDWEDHFAQQESSLRAAVQADKPGAPFDWNVHMLALQGDQAVVRVRTAAIARAPAYRQTRFYRRTEERWQQTPPDPSLWGPERSLATLFFRFRFRQQDAPAVSAVAAQVDDLYTTLWRNVGLPLTLGAEKLVIEVSVTQPPGQVTPWFQASDRFLVPSPAVYLAPVELTDAQLLAQSITLGLLAHVLAQASERHQIGLAWQPLLSGLHSWQVWDLDLPLSVWREDIVQWLYVDVLAATPGQPIGLPDRYQELCAAHLLWMPSPVQMNIPLRCAEGDRQDWFLSRWRSRGALTHLDQLVPLLLPSEDGDSQGEPHYVSHPGQAVALTTLIEYAVATYGRERLPALMAGLGQYDTWDTLLPAVFGVSASEFEAGWQAYWATHYGHRTG